MKERPILFNAPMVRALLDGTKTQTRRIVKPQPQHPQFGRRMMLALDDEGVDLFLHGGPLLPRAIRSPYGQPGDHLWVRETHAKVIGQSGDWIETDYRATYTHGDRLGDTIGIRKRWTPAIHMPRAASRINLEVTGVRIERLQDISRGAMAEGCPFPNMAQGNDPRKWYRDLWEQINGVGSSAANPWVWVIEFEKKA